MDKALRVLVWSRAQAICEYCRTPQVLTDAVHEIDHVIPEKHDGKTELQNLALACFPCNNHKSAQISGFDIFTPSTLTRLFHPRTDQWDDHFEWDRALLMGKTAIGRVTVTVLNINARHRVAFREALIEEGVFPVMPSASLAAER